MRSTSSCVPGTEGGDLSLFGSFDERDVQVGWSSVYDRRCICMITRSWMDPSLPQDNSPAVSESG